MANEESRTSGWSDKNSYIRFFRVKGMLLEQQLVPEWAITNQRARQWLRREDGGRGRPCRDLLGKDGKPRCIESYRVGRPGGIPEFPSRRPKVRVYSKKDIDTIERAFAQREGAEQAPEVIETPCDGRYLHEPVERGGLHWGVVV